MKHINADVDIDTIPIVMEICILWVENGKHAMCCSISSWTW